MTQPLTARMTRENARPALIVGGGVGAVLLAQLVLSTVLSVLSYVGYGATGSPTGTWDLQTMLSPLAGFWYTLLLQIVPFSVGVLLAIWLLLPLNAATGVVRVAIRLVAASAAGALLVIVVGAVWGVVPALASAGPMFSNWVPRVDGYSLFFGVTTAVQSGLSQFVQNTPVVVLVGILVIFFATLAARVGGGSDRRIS